MKTLQAIAITSLCSLSLAACTQTTTTTPDATAPPPASEPAGNAQSTSTTQKAQAATQAQKDTAAKLVLQVENADLEAPESVLYVPEEDVYLVSNVVGKPTDADGKGYISKIGPDGKVIDLRYIDGQKPGVNLDAPKGMAISNGVLYVTDIKWIRMFDAKTGAPKGKLFAKGATFLNDMTTDAEGVVYATDSGWKAGKNGFANTGSDTVYKIDPKRVVAEPIVSDEKLGNPNGLATTKDTLWVVNSKGELFQLTDEGEKKQVTTLDAGGLDGIVALDDGTFLVSSWGGKAIYHGKPGGKFKQVVANLPSPADIGYDSKRKRLLIPSMDENRILVYSVDNPQAAAAQAPAPGRAKQATAKADKKGGAKGKGKAQGADKKAKPAAKKSPAKKKSAAPKKGATPATPAEPADPKAGKKKATPAKPAQPPEPEAKKQGAKPQSKGKPAPKQ